MHNFTPLLPKEFNTKNGCFTVVLNVILILITLAGIFLPLFIKDYVFPGIIVFFAGLVLLVFSFPLLFTHYVLTQQGIIIKNKLINSSTLIKWDEIQEAEKIIENEYNIQTYNYKDLNIKEYENNVFVLRIFTSNKEINIKENEICQFNDLSNIVEYKLKNRFRDYT